jgi:hypothetical protein
MIARLSTLNQALYPEPKTAGCKVKSIVLPRTFCFANRLVDRERYPLPDGTVSEVRELARTSDTFAPSELAVFRGRLDLSRGPNLDYMCCASHSHTPLGSILALSLEIGVVMSSGDQDGCLQSAGLWDRALPLAGLVIAVLVNLVWISFLGYGLAKLL